jgi:hypothetical protein
LEELNREKEKEKDIKDKIEVRDMFDFHSIPDVQHVGDQ